MPAYYADTVANFLGLTGTELEQRLLHAYESDRFKELFLAQVSSWRQQIADLQSAFVSANLKDRCAAWGIALEFVIPRKMGRIDATILVGDAIVVLEFKTTNVDSSAADQVEDYCLDLLHFHSASHGKTIYPVVIGDRSAKLPRNREAGFGSLRPTVFCNGEQIGAALSNIADQHSNHAQTAINEWDMGEYRPVPTIVEAAIGMFAEMQVQDIARADSDPKNLTETISAIEQQVRVSRDNSRKTVCFVTGVPGAGKTLAGLRVVHDSALRTEMEADSVFLSGNLPLVKVLQGALAKDIAQRKKQKLRVSIRNPKTTVDTVLGYKKTHARSDNPPHEQIVVFDEAQRAWDAAKTAKYLDESSVEYKDHSEPELIMAILERHPWATLIALVGGGQEINDGEAGLSEWGRALLKRNGKWRVAVSPQALSGEYGAGAKLFEHGIPENIECVKDPNLHLDNPTRQFRGKTMALWAEALLKGDRDEAKRILEQNPDYPVRFTRDLSVAKLWLQSTARGTERFGCIASSEARRLRAEGLELPPARADGVEHWFLTNKGDVRSSFQMEVAANEFQIQGLEIDWSCVCWGGDFLRTAKDEWELKRFRGTTWQKVNQAADRQYIINTYRVLLTRARQGMVLFVPIGTAEDKTRTPEPFDWTAEFLISCGAVPL
jgi:hypothetical protein